VEGSVYFVLMDTKAMIAELRAERERIDAVIKLLSDVTDTTTHKRPSGRLKGANQKKRTMSPESRMKMADSQRKRWARVRRPA